MEKQYKNKALLGAAFLMATSAVGPGFLTQTTLFTAQLGASFAFVVLISTLLDIGAQVNIWRAVSASGASGPALADKALRGLGYLLSSLIVFGGLAFNIGNIAGAGLGLQALAGIPIAWGAAFSAALALALFWAKETGRALDLFAQTLGMAMVALIAWMAVAANPPLGEVALQSVWPEKVDFTAILTIVGGTVGGYISFAGAHRLLAAGISGPAQVESATKSAVTGIWIAALMRFLLFLAVLGVVATGFSVDPANPPASVFRAAAGEWGTRFFGIVMWSAALTSVVGCTFTSVSFLSASVPLLGARPFAAHAIFVLISLTVFLLVGKPVQLLVWAGLANGLVLPIALAAVLWVARTPEHLRGYRLPWQWQCAGWAVVALMGGMAVASLF
jgi:Mn2+/Fe2+ NRAMP family transporter